MNFFTIPALIIGNRMNACFGLLFPESDTPNYKAYICCSDPLSMEYWGRSDRASLVKAIEEELKSRG